MAMDESAITFLDLPTEILYMVFKQLNNMHVLYSFFGVDEQRLDTIVSNFTFTQSLNFILTTADGRLLPVPQPMLDRFCLDILPKIHQSVKSLTVPSKSIERILLAADFPNLTELRLCNVDENIISRYFTGKKILL